MGRRRKADNFDQLQELLTLMPWWIGPILALLMFLGIRFLLPRVFTTSEQPLSPGHFIRGLASTLSWVCGGLVLLAWVLAEIAKLSNRRLSQMQGDSTALNL